MGWVGASRGAGDGDVGSFVWPIRPGIPHYTTAYVRGTAPSDRRHHGRRTNRPAAALRGTVDSDPQVTRGEGRLSPSWRILREGADRAGRRVAAMATWAHSPGRSGLVSSSSTNGRHAEPNSTRDRTRAKSSGLKTWSWIFARASGNRRTRTGQPNRSSSVIRPSPRPRSFIGKRGGRIEGLVSRLWELRHLAVAGRGAFQQPSKVEAGDVNGFVLTSVTALEQQIDLSFRRRAGPAGGQLRIGAGPVEH